MKTVDLMLVRKLCKGGFLKAYVQDGKIYLRDMENGECVCIGEAALSCQECRENGTSKVCEDKRTGYVCPNKADLEGTT